MRSEPRMHLIFMTEFEAWERSLHCWKLGTSWKYCWAIAKWWNCFLLIEGNGSVSHFPLKAKEWSSGLSSSSLLPSLRWDTKLLDAWHRHHPGYRVLPHHRPRSNGVKWLWMGTNKTINWINLLSVRLLLLGGFICASEELSTLSSW